jgi:hypothetical protein
MEIGSTNLRHVFGVAEKVYKVSFGEIESVGSNYVGTGVKIVYMNLPNHIRGVFDAMLSPSDPAPYQLSTYGAIKEHMSATA